MMTKQKTMPSSLLPHLLLCGILLSGAAGTAQSQENSASSSITVITSADIARDKPAGIIEYLGQKVGVNESGAQLTMRGVQGVVIVIDNVAGTSIPDWLKPEDVERIEIVRGAASSRYGASAMGGAIVITTKKGTGRKNIDLIQGYGSFGRHFTKAVASGNSGRWNIRLAGEENVTNNMYEAGPADMPFPSMVYVQEDSGTRKTVDVSVGGTGERLSSDVNLNYSYGHSINGRPNSWIDSRRLKARWTTKYVAADWLEISPVLSYDDWFVYRGLKDKGTGTDAAGLAPDRIINDPSRTQAIELQAIMKNKDTRLTTGIKLGVDEEDATIEDYFTNALRFENSYRMVQQAAFVLLETVPFDQTSLDISGRYDRYRYYDVFIDDTVNKIYGAPLIKESFNPKLGFKWKTSEQYALRGTLSTGFVPPSPYNLYFQDTSSPANQVLSNPDLKPETSRTADIGLDIRWPFGFTMGVTFFSTLWKDKVDRVYTVTATTQTQQPRNIGESKSRGLELQLDEQFNDQWSLFFNYTLNRTEITKNESDPSIVGNEVPDIPRHKFNLGLTHQKKDDFTAKAVWRYTGSRFLDQENTVRDANGFLWKRDAYSVVDVAFTKHWKPGSFVDNLELTLAVDNLFDERYGKWFFYRDPGRVVRGELAMRF